MAGRLAVSLRLAAALAALAICWSVPAAAQERVLTWQAVRAELEYRLARDPGDAAVWNTGYDLYRLYPRNQTTAAAIHRGFLSARGQTPEQRLILMKAAIYWEKVHDYGVVNVPVGRDDSYRDHPYWVDGRKQTTLGLKRPQGGPAPYRDDRAPWAHRAARRPPYQGRLDNPYPGPYYPGVYPP